MTQSVGPALVRALEFNKQSDTWVYFLTAFNWYCISNIIFFVAMLFYIAAAFAWVWMDFVLEPDELDRMDTLTSLYNWASLVGALIFVTGPSRAKSASRSLRRALLMSQVNTGSLYRRGRSD